MTTEQIIKKLEDVSAKQHMPALARNKSWLFVAKDKEGELHFYDTKYSPDAAYKRIAVAQPDYEILDIIPYTDADGATGTVKTLRDATALFKHYNAQVRVAAST